MLFWFLSKADSFWLVTKGGGGERGHWPVFSESWGGGRDGTFQKRWTVMGSQTFYSSFPFPKDSRFQILKNFFTFSTNSTKAWGFSVYTLRLWHKFIGVPLDVQESCSWLRSGDLRLWEVRNHRTPPPLPVQGPKLVPSTIRNVLSPGVFIYSFSSSGNRTIVLKLTLSGLHGLHSNRHKL